MKLQGSMVALVTPFTETGAVNFDKLGQLIDWHVEKHTDALLVLGTTGEAATMSHEENTAVCEYAVKRAGGRLPVFAGSGCNCTQQMLEKSLEYEALGADGLLLITPYYNKSNTEGMAQHFLQVADKVHVPCILYNVPGRTGCSIPVSVVERLACHPNIMGIKEASGNISYTSQVARYVGDDFALYSGNDDMVIPLMSLGGSGVISVWANIMPFEVHEMVHSYIGGNTEKALKIQLTYLELIHHLFTEVNPIPVKAAMNLMGMEVGGYRLPLYEMSGGAKEGLRREMQACGLLK